MDSPSIDTSGQQRAAEAAAKAQQAATNLQKNMSADLATENITKIVAGGSADANAADIATGMRKKKPGDSLSSQLGISV